MNMSRMPGHGLGRSAPGCLSHAVPRPQTTGHACKPGVQDGRGLVHGRGSPGRPSCSCSWLLWPTAGALLLRRCLAASSAAAVSVLEINRVRVGLQRWPAAADRPGTASPETTVIGPGHLTTGVGGGGKWSTLLPRGGGRWWGPRTRQGRMIMSVSTALALCCVQSQTPAGLPPLSQGPEILSSVVSSSRQT